MNFQKARNDKQKDACIPDELVVSNVRTRDIDLKHSGQCTSENSKEAECLVPVDEDDRTNAPTDLQHEQVNEEPGSIMNIQKLGNALERDLSLPRSATASKFKVLRLLHSNPSRVLHA
ncbi:hypothetical protein V6N12_050604 [Hibiscus sabdariffa]|uniref:Uncharacterized protein n=1 Tax=Hibiscus sabdariffa TaxID=183260 RepID=A0ABR2GD24_9ROSI